MEKEHRSQMNYSEIIVHQAKTCMLGFCTVSHIKFMSNWLTGLSVLQQVKVTKSQVGGHALSNRLNSKLNLLSYSARSGKSSVSA